MGAEGPFEVVAGIRGAGDRDACLRDSTHASLLGRALPVLSIQDLIVASAIDPDALREAILTLGALVRDREAVP